MKPGMRPDLEKPNLIEKPLVGTVESMLAMRTGIGQDAGRAESILSQLRQKLSDHRQKLSDRRRSNVPVTMGRRAADRKVSQDQDKYEQQRINRKICWQYDQTAKKVPLLRRNYI